MVEQIFRIRDSYFRLVYSLVNRDRVLTIQTEKKQHPAEIDLIIDNWTFETDVPVLVKITINTEKGSSSILRTAMRVQGAASDGNLSLKVDGYSMGPVEVNSVKSIVIERQ